MRRPEFIARQSRCPTGLLGRFIARIMAAETAEANVELLSLLNPQPTDHLLEIGFGHGRTIERAAAQVPHGIVAGVDLSEEMVRMATHHLRHLIREQRVDLQLGDSAHLQYPDGRFDRAYSLHTLYFWPDPQQHLREIYRVLKPGGRFVIGFGPRDDEKASASFPATVYRFYTSDEVRDLLDQVGFRDIDMIPRSISSRTIVFAIAHRR
ncbi:MAG: class I SAM-dependent methyltransferase [Deltaproteobacteria bacterium]|nr:class I SAM-dependent methyltransferase [Deltaproteobacteria bacterium]MBI3389932.1 class I SAM-dependent methyltransferase [Deltaproteobacteria bacterium]